MTRSFRRNLNVYQTLSMLSFSWFLWSRHWVVIQLCDWTHLFKCYLFIITIFIDTRAFTVSAGFSFKLFFVFRNQTTNLFHLEAGAELLGLKRHRMQ